MGLKPPLSLQSAIIFPPNRMGLTSAGHPPRSSRFMKSVRASTNGPHASPNPTKSSKWPGLKPSGPPADPDGNERLAPSTSAVVTCHAPAASGAGRLLSASGSGSTGCLSRKRPRLCSFGSAGCPPSQRIRTAALMLPSLSLAFTAASKAPSPFLDPLRLPSRPDSQTPIAVRDMLAVDLPSSHSTVRHLMVFVILRRLPARDGLAKMEGAKSKKSCPCPDRLRGFANIQQGRCQSLSTGLTYPLANMPEQRPMCHVPDHVYPTPFSIAVHYVSGHVNTSIRMCRQLGRRWSSRNLTTGPCHPLQRRAVGARAWFTSVSM